MIIVTGGAGFIGSNIVRHLNAKEDRELLIVDDLSDGHKIHNLVDCYVADYIDKGDFFDHVDRHDSLRDKVKAVIHQGACTATTEWDGKMMMQTNFEFSKRLLHYCDASRIPLIYASSASVYGTGTDFRADDECEKAINVYAFSKLMFDRYVRNAMSALRCQAVGLRYFNVYGPGEVHKGEMASVVYHFHRQINDDGVVRLFEGSGQFGDGEQRRDFIHVDDVAAVNLWFLDHPECRGIYNLGTGTSRSFNEVAKAVIAWHGRGQIEYIPFPKHLLGSYQSFTESDQSGLRAAGYDQEFLSIEEGVDRYLSRIGHADPGSTTAVKPSGESA